MPIFLPIIKSLGYDPVWFGILFNMQIAYLSPPFGGACFFLKSVAPPDVTMEEIFASCWPWMGLQLIALILVMVFPEIALWLPRVAGRAAVARGVSGHAPPSAEGSWRARRAARCDDRFGSKEAGVEPGFQFARCTAGGVHEPSVTAGFGQ